VAYLTLKIDAGDAGTGLNPFDLKEIPITINMDNLSALRRARGYLQDSPKVTICSILIPLVSFSGFSQQRKNLKKKEVIRMPDGKGTLLDALIMKTFFWQTSVNYLERILSTISFRIAFMSKRLSPSSFAFSSMLAA
jgi:hypothetical protein